ncbi:hypothetical protein TRFO_26225 [Tritrichomonas foetus]|uniref:MIF4G domain containing protein n=1 Tax=Tritrichomonas foetus TaxID=1144522 RepID=A0A1J4K4H8_9EUKA|nr:hypothetical protein TRFO_26225 [Tritrichomonas foetus]|eukprot:OHT05874.1 hypothetical protein TRFO_26225 [Tritrichomonas foetus]
MATISSIEVHQEVTPPKKSTNGILTLCLTRLMPMYQTTSPPLQLRSNSYTIEEAMSFRHNFQINDDQIKIMQSDFDAYFRSLEFWEISEKKNSSNFEFSTSKPPSSNMSSINTPTILAKSTDTVKTQIITLLNKLTLEKFEDIFNSMAECIQISSDFDIKYSKIICSIASQQRIFAPIYSMFTARICEILEDPTNMIHKIKELCFIDTQEITEGTASFIGCLVQNSIFSTTIVFDFLKKLYNERTEKSFEILYFTAIPSGGKIEFEIPESKKFFDDVFKTAASMKSRIKYLMMDLEEARNHNWDVKNLLPATVTRETADQIYRQSMPNEGERILREFIEENELPSKYSQKMPSRAIKSVFMALLQSTRKVYDNGKNITLQMKQNGILSEKIAINLFREVIATATTSEVLHDYPNIKRRIGALFCQLIAYNIMQMSHFGSAFSFDIDIFGGFLGEARDLNMVDKIKRSPWMSQMRFRPKTFSHMQLTDVIDTEGMTECWTLYELTASVIDLMNSDEDPAELKNMIETEFPSDVVNSVDFAEFIAEVIVIFKPKRYIHVLSTYAKKHCDAALIHIGKLGKYYQWNYELTRSQIEGFASLFDYDVSILDF